MPNLGPTELIIIAVIIMVLFGAKRLPDSARALGRSMRILKAETKGMRDDADTTVPSTTVQAQPLPPVQAPTQAPVQAPVPPPAQQAAAQQPVPPSPEQSQQRSA